MVEIRLMDEVVKSKSRAVQAAWNLVASRGGCFVEVDGDIAVWGVRRGFVTKTFLRRNHDELLRMVRARRAAMGAEAAVADVMPGGKVLCRKIIVD